MITQLQTVEKAPPTRAPGKKVNWVPIAACVGGGGVLALGIWLALREVGVKPGGTIRAHYKFDYIGEPTEEPANYVLQVRLGWMVWGEPIPWFTPTEGMLWTLPISITGPGEVEFDVDCLIPMGASARIYDAEAQIKHPDQEESQYIIRELYDNAVKVEKVA